MERRKQVRLKDVADRARVSATTASVVLSGRAEEFRIAPDTRDHVLATASDLGYVPSGSRRRSARASTPALWSIFAPSDFESGPISQFLRGTQAYVDERKLQVDCVVFPFERGRLEEKQQWISPAFTRGALMLGLTDDDVAFINSTSFDVPVVLYNRVAKGCASVLVEDYSAGQQVMRQFRSRGLEHFAVVAPAHAGRSTSMRSIGFMDELRRHLGDDAAAQQVLADPGDLDQFALALDSLQLAGQRTGIFVLNDQLIGAVLNWVRGRGLTAPDDVELVSYGDSPINSLLRPTVSSVFVPADKMSLECAKTLHQAITHPEAMTDVSRTFEAHLVFRETSPEPAG